MDIFKSIGNFFGWIAKKSSEMIDETIKAFKEAMYGVKLQSKQTNRYDVDFDILDQNHNIETLKGKVSPNEELGFIPQIDKMVFRPSIWKKNDRRIIIVSKKQQDTQALDKEIELQNAISGVLEIKTKVEPNRAYKIMLNHDERKKITSDWIYDDIWCTLQYKLTHGSIDPTKFDNELSVDFATQSKVVSEADSFSFLKKTPDMGGLTNIIIGVLLGIVLKGMF